MRIVRTDDCDRLLLKLSQQAQRLYGVQEERFNADSRDSRLHIKKLHAVPGVYSFRISRAYRALFYFSANGACVVFAIGDRKDVYRGL